MTQQQVINFIKKKRTLLPIIQANVKLLTPAVQNAALHYRADYIEELLDIPNFQPIDDIKKFCLRYDFDKNIDKIKNFSDDIYKWIAENQPTEICHLKNVPQFVKWIAIKNSPINAYRMHPTQQMMQYAFELNPNVIQYIDNPTHQQIMSRIKRGAALHRIQRKYLRALSQDEQIYVVQNNFDGLRGLLNAIPNLSQKVKIAAIQSNVAEIWYIKNPNEKQIIAAYKKDPTRAATLLKNHPANRTGQLTKILNLSTYLSNYPFKKEIEQDYQDKDRLRDLRGIDKE